MPRIDVSFKVNKQMIIQTPVSKIAAGGKNYFYAVFDLCDTWNDITAEKAVFIREDIRKVIPLSAGENDCLECKIPWEVMQEPGFFHVGIFGGNTLLTNTIHVKVIEGCVTEGDEPLPPTPDWFNEIDRQMAELNKKMDSGAYDGEDGLSAYEIAVQNGFEGSEQEWLESLKGEKGDTPDVNLENGEGEVSLEQVAWKEEAANSAKGKGAVALGGYNKADAKCSMAVNYDNEVLATNGFAANSGNKIPENCIGAFVAGHRNEAKGEYQAIFGTYADAETNDALVIGNGNANGKSNAFKVKKTGDVKASGGITSDGRIEAQSISAPGMSTTNMTVYNNAKIENDLSCKTFTASEDASIGTANIAKHHTSYGKNRVSGRGSAAFGGNNEVKGDTSFACITSNTIPENLTHIFIAGHANTATGSHQAIFGTYANPKATDRFVVGNGNSAGRNNAFAVDSSGNIRIGGNTITIGSTTITEAQLNKLLELIK